MASLDFTMHERQQEVFDHPARLKVVVAGRQSGKSHLMMLKLIHEALLSVNARGHKLGHDHEVIYAAPTFQQAHNVFWPRLKKFAAPITEKAMENTGILYLKNGRRIRMIGMDNPDSARGATASFVGLDEYADMPDRAWAEIVQPMLMITEGEALFIGTPKGKNHFYKLYKDAEADVSGDWAAFNFPSTANPLLTQREYQRMVRDTPPDKREQELEASFTAAEGMVFRREWFKFDPIEPEEGEYVIAVDLAGFSSSGQGNRKNVSRLDETAIAIVKIHDGGWWVKEIVHGQWDIKETTTRIIAAMRSVQCSTIGIEKGALSNAITPFLHERMIHFGRFAHILPLTHGNNRKQDRIAWALQGRAEQGRVVLNPGKWADKLVGQAMDFPDPRAKDDLLDALAYIDQAAPQIATSSWQSTDEWQPLDSDMGY